MYHGAPGLSNPRQSHLNVDELHDILERPAATYQDQVPYSGRPSYAGSTACPTPQNELDVSEKSSASLDRQVSSLIHMLCRSML